MAPRPSEPWEGQTFADLKTKRSRFAPLPSAFLAAPENPASALVRGVCTHSLLFWQVVAIFSPS